MDKIKVLFADIYRLHAAMKGELKIISKSNEQFLLAGDEQKANMTASDIIDSARNIQAIAQAMIDNAESYLQE